MKKGILLLIIAAITVGSTNSVFADFLQRLQQKSHERKHERTKRREKRHGERVEKRYAKGHEWRKDRIARETQEELKRREAENLKRLAESLQPNPYK